MSSQVGKPLYPPRDFVPTSLVFGIWAGEILAGTNYIRMGIPGKGRTVIRLSIILQVCMGGVLMLLYRMVNTSAGHALAAGLWLLINFVYGYCLYRMQSASYRTWTSEQPEQASVSPYLPEWSCVVLLIFAIATMALVLKLSAR